ncbi:uncharacterized protein LOC124273679 [Haliotis rubra]|uniref:uncharacterized protein LOC124273679 n=1 Tax=Haliotis rubra TaxID=36100 RepID=UPI001EE524DE|nr:uncharacterized protein LOC124273679 [Haliotis rubra]
MAEVKLPTFETSYVARDFGLDITVPDGGLVSSAASQRQYKTECGRIYKEFIVTMGDYFQEEDSIKQQLKQLQSQKNTGSHIGRDVDQESLMGDTISAIFSRLGSRKGGFVTSYRPQTAGMCAKRQPVIVPHPPNRPSTVADYSKEVNMKRRLSYPRRRSSVHHSVASDPFDGVMDQKTQHTRERKLRMHAIAFSKLLAGEVNIKLQNKDGKFVLKHAAMANSGAASATKGDTSRPADYKEKIALVRQKTSFKSPTLSSDLKINNLVAIQKSLMGLPSKRITVSEIMRKAEDRRARLCKVEVTSAQDRNGGIYGEAGKSAVDADLADDKDVVPGHDGVKLVKVEARKRRNSSACTMSQDGKDNRRFKESFLNALATPRDVIMNRTRKSYDSTPRDMYIDTSAKDDDTWVSDQSESGTPRAVTARDAVQLVRRSKEEDKERERQLFRWRQRMTFAAVKRNGLARVLSGTGACVTLG